MAKMFNGNSKQDGRGPDKEMGGFSNLNDVVDIREDKREKSLGEMLRTNLGGGVSGQDAPVFPSLLLWDQQGLQLFEAITYSDEYYLTESEIEIFEQHGQEMAQKIAPGTVLIELGSGNLRKIRILLQAIDNLGCEIDYYALDLSSSELERSLEQISPGTFKHVRCHGLLGTYDDGRKWLQRRENLHRPKCILSLGSTIGSFTRPEAADFLSKFAASLDCKVSSLDPQHAVESSVLIALDGCMIGEKVYRAYNDAQGLNCSFILNALDHANHVLGYEAFRKSEWTVRGEWNAAAGSHDQYLVPVQDVAFEGRDFEAGKRIPVVSSFKYDVKHKAQLWKAAGLIEKARWTKSNGSYAIHMLSGLGALPN